VSRFITTAQVLRLLGSGESSPLDGNIELLRSVFRTSAEACERLDETDRQLSQALLRMTWRHFSHGSSRSWRRPRCRSTVVPGRLSSLSRKSSAPLKVSSPVEQGSLGSRHSWSGSQCKGLC
jgi:hypothetical protein